MPTVSTFEPAAIVGRDADGNDILGLNNTHNFETTAIITGTGFADQMSVNVTGGTITWSGNLLVPSGSTERGSVALTCNNPPGLGRLRDPESVSVTVGDSMGVAFIVPVGTP